MKNYVFQSLINANILIVTLENVLDAILGTMCKMEDVVLQQGTLRSLLTLDARFGTGKNKSACSAASDGFSKKMDNARKFLKNVIPMEHKENA